jgi:putative ABC transport system permease protein
MLHKLRSFLTMLGVVFGVGSVIAMLAVGEGTSRETLEKIQKLGTNNIILSAAKPSEDEQTDKKQTFMSVYGLLYDDELRIKESLSAVKKTVPAKLLPKMGRYGKRQMELRVVGTTPEWFEVIRRPLIAGRLFAEKDFLNLRMVCVLTERVARQLLVTEHAIGQSIRIGGEYFQVIGIVQSFGGRVGGIHMPDIEIDVYIPLNVCRQRFGDVFAQRITGAFLMEKVELHQIIVQVDRMEQVETTAAVIKAMLERFHKREDYQISVPVTLLNQAKSTKRTFNIVLGTIAGISLLVGGIGIMNIMLASVTERTREIGIRRAIGATQRQIVRQFLMETVVLSTCGGLLGILTGIGIPHIISYLTGIPTIVTTISIALSLGISISVGIVFGLYPAVRAANMDPITALRYE